MIDFNRTTLFCSSATLFSPLVTIFFICTFTPSVFPTPIIPQDLQLSYSFPLTYFKFD